MGALVIDWKVAWHEKTAKSLLIMHKERYGID